MFNAYVIWHENHFHQRLAKLWFVASFVFSPLLRHPPMKLCFRMLKRMLRRCNIYVVDFLLTEECYSEYYFSSLASTPSNLNRFVFAWDVAKQHACAENHTSSMTKAPPWSWHNPFLGIWMTFWCPLIQPKSSIGSALPLEVNWRATSPARHLSELTLCWDAASTERA